MAVKTETFKNPHCRLFHSRALLTEKREQYYERGDDNIEGVSGIFLSFAGVLGCIVNPYSILVLKSPAFDWSEIQPRIIEILEAMAEGK